MIRALKHCNFIYSGEQLRKNTRIEWEGSWPHHVLSPEAQAPSLCCQGMRLPQQPWQWPTSEWKGTCPMPCSAAYIPSKHHPRAGQGQKALTGNNSSWICLRNCFASQKLLLCDPLKVQNLLNLDKPWSIHSFIQVTLPKISWQEQTSFWRFWYCNFLCCL